MPTRDEHGHYVTDQGVTIKTSEYDGGLKIDMYDKIPSDSDHKSIHIKANDDGSFKTIDNVNGAKEESSGQCYLTSACMKHFMEAFDDNCRELTILRWFRDRCVKETDKSYYYAIAPVIVNVIDNNSNGGELYGYIYNHIIAPCVEAIEAGDYEFAYERYKSSTLLLEKNIAKPELQKRLVRVLKSQII